MKFRRNKMKSEKIEEPLTADEAIEGQARPEGSSDAEPAGQSSEERIVELEQLLLRSQADYANLRRRSFSDQQAAVARAEGALLGELLTFADWLDMALASEAQSPDAIVLKEGVRLTREQLSSLLAREGVEPIKVEGEFNAQFHQAVAAIEGPCERAGQIAEVVRGGWRRNEAVLRHAQVKVWAAPAVEQGADEAASEQGTDAQSEA